MQIGPHSEGQTKSCARRGVSGAEMNRAMYGVVVDDDVDIHNWHDVMWAIATRCRPDRDGLYHSRCPPSRETPTKWITGAV